MKMMVSVERIVSIVLLCVLLMQLIGCSAPAWNAGETTSRNTVSVETTDQAGTDENILTVFCWYFDQERSGSTFYSLRSKAESELKKVYPNAEIEYYDPTNGDSTMDYATAFERLVNDLIVGKGPDVIIGVNDFDRVAGVDITKQVQSGVFEDLSGFMAENERFANIPAAFLPGGTSDGAQYVLPLYYYLDLHLTCNDALESCGVTKEELSADVDTAMCALLQYMEGDSARSVFYNTEYIGSPKALMAYLWPDGQSLLNGMGTELFENTMAVFKLDKEKSDELNAIARLDTYTYNGQQYTSIINELEVQGSAVANGQALWLPGYGDFSLAALKAYTLEPMGGVEVIPLQNISGGATARITEYAVVRASSSKKDLAHAYINAYYDASLINNLYTYQLPICADDLQARMEKALTDNSFNGTAILKVYFGELPWYDEWHRQAGEKSGGKAPENVPFKIPETLTEQTMEYVAGINDAFYSYLPYEIVLECFMDYFNGTASYKECLSDAEFQLELYISE